MIRNCLSTMGLITLLMITSCVVGVSSCSRVFDPKQFVRHVDEDPAKTRRMLMAYLDAATNEGPADWKLEGKATRVLVQEYTDGSIHLAVDGTKGRMMEVVAKITPSDDDDAKVEVLSDAKVLADAKDIAAHEVHRRIKDMVSGALDAIDGHRVVEGGFLVSRLIGERERTRRRF
jgi:outer membrane PBP1 activator LpoA protein